MMDMKLVAGQAAPESMILRVVVKLFLGVHIGANGMINDPLANTTFMPALQLPCAFVSAWLILSAFYAMFRQPERDVPGALGVLFYIGWSVTQVALHFSSPKIMIIYTALSLMAFAVVLVAGRRV